MKLIKSVCKHCFKKSLRSEKWNELDDWRWKNDRVFCISKKKVINNVIDEDDECKFSLEHLVGGKK